MTYFKRILDLRVICVPETMCELLTSSFSHTNWHQAVALVLDWPKEIRIKWPSGLGMPVLTQFHWAFSIITAEQQSDTAIYFCELYDPLYIPQKSVLIDILFIRQWQMEDDGQCKRLIILQPDSSLTFKHFNSLSDSNATKTQNKYECNDSAASNFTSCPLHYISRKQITTRRKVEDAPCEHSDNGGEERSGRKPPSLLRVEDRGRVYWISWGTSADVEIWLLLF